MLVRVLVLNDPPARAGCLVFGGGDIAQAGAEIAAAFQQLGVGPSICCPPRHSTHAVPWLLAVNGILWRGKHSYVARRDIATHDDPSFVAFSGIS